MVRYPHETDRGMELGALKITLNKHRPGDVTLRVHDREKRRDDDQDNLPDVSVLVLHHGLPIYNHREVSAAADCDRVSAQ